METKISIYWLRLGKKKSDKIRFLFKKFNRCLDNFQPKWKTIKFIIRISAISLEK